jgi:hypothetical protein
VQQPLGLTEHAFDALLMSALLLSTGFDPATMPPLKPGAAGAALVAEVGALFVGCAHPDGGTRSRHAAGHAPAQVRAAADALRAAPRAQRAEARARQPILGEVRPPAARVARRAARTIATGNRHPTAPRRAKWRRTPPVPRRLTLVWPPHSANAARRVRGMRAAGLS